MSTKKESGKSFSFIQSVSELLFQLQITIIYVIVNQEGNFLSSEFKVLVVCIKFCFTFNTVQKIMFY